MKQVFIMGTALLALLTFTNAYAVTPEQNQKILQLETGLIAQDAAELLRESQVVIQTCTILSEMDLLSDKCAKFVADYRDAIKGVMDRYESGTNTEASNTLLPIGKLLDNTTNDTAIEKHEPITKFPPLS